MTASSAEENLRGLSIPSLDQAQEKFVVHIPPYRCGTSRLPECFIPYTQGVVGRERVLILVFNDSWDV